MSKRIVAILLTICILFTGLVFSPFMASAVDELVFEHSDFASIYGAHLNYDSSLRFIPGKDGAADTYSLQIDLYSTYSLNLKNKGILSTKDDYYEIDRPGAYLVELWGGDGASAVGKGGDGGYVYGIIDDLNEGDILYYSLGSAGTETNKTALGGGANGGGGYGENGSNTVGGGGGYSALFLFRSEGENNEFRENYLDSDNELVGALTESDRTSKYIMIAGGGGGGGSYGNDSNATADGGSGGHMESTSGVLSGSYDVAGTFFSGENGKSSGTSTQYVGRGGTNVPGAIVKTTGNAGSTDQPNDWIGSYNQDLEGGAGGSGNYRGGGGGGGFCGGSGGLMTSVFLATNVGGGGGGSSFVEQGIIDTPLTEANKALLLGKNADEKNGQIHIIYLGETDDEYLEDMSVSFARTPYYVFNSVSVETWDSATGSFVPFVHTQENTSNENIEFEPGVEVAKLTFKNLSLHPKVDGTEKDHARITINFMPNPHFAGGNDVPIFMNDEIICTPADNHYDAVSLKFNNYCGYLNIPLNFNVSPRNHTDQGLDPENISHPITSLYNDLYDDVRTDANDDPSSDWRYRFIESIGKHVVKYESGEVITADTVTPDETTRYLISLDVVPKIPLKPRAKFGDMVTQKTFVGVSVVTVAGTGMATFNGNIVVYTKTLNHTPENSVDYYTMELRIASDSSGSIADADVLPKFESMSTSLGDYEDDVIIPLTGEYKITVTGGYGGQGGGTTVNIGSFTGGNGLGGEGGSVTATFGLVEGTRLLFSVGANGEDMSERYKGALGGECSYVAVVDENHEILQYLLIASGGGGGGGAGSVSNGGKGSSPEGFSTEQLASLEAYKGGAGGDGGFFQSGGTGGAAVANYINTAPSGNVEFISNLEPTAASEGCGTATLTCLGVGIGGEGISDNLKSYTIDSYISKYFEVVGATVDVVSGDIPEGKTSILTFDYEGDENKVLDAGGDLLYTKTKATIDIDPVELTDVTNDSISSSLGSDGDPIYKIDYILKIKVKPRDGFLGGNDVLLLYADDEESFAPTGISITQDGKSDKITVDESRAYDYANVALDQSFMSDEKFTFEKQDQVYIVGGAPVIKNTLVGTLEGLPDVSGWQGDYVDLVDPTKDTTPLTPSETTTYTLKAGIEPKVLVPNSKGGAAVSEAVATVDAVVHTNAKVSFVLTGIEEFDINGGELSNEEKTIEFNLDGHAASDYTFKLKTMDMGEDHDHHHLPNQITVTVGDVTLVQGVDFKYDYIDENNATVTIYAENINANITVTAAACHEYVTLYYVYQNQPESDEYTTIELQRHFGMAINIESDIKGAGYALPSDDYEHYDFVWDYGLEDGAILETMPKQNVWIVGRYIPNIYDITVNYVYADDDSKAADSVTEQISYNGSYNIVSPVISGFVADSVTVSGTATSHASFTVKYKSAEGRLNIICLYRDSGEIVREANNEYIINGECSISFADGAAYDVPMPSVVGYTPDTDSVKGTMTSLGATVYVYYDAQRYTVTFNADGGSCVVSDKLVEYNKTYGYNADTELYDGLPTPVKVGYDFEGWMLDGVLVDESSTVSATADHTLTAKWKGMDFTLTIEYIKDDGTTAFSSVTKTLEFNSSYSYTSPTLRGYKPDKETVSGVMPAQNTVIVVTYDKRTYTVTVQFLYSDGGGEAAPTVTQSVKHAEPYKIEIPSVSGYYTSSDEAYEEGVVDAADVDIIIYYYAEAPSMDFTVSWSDMTFVYNLGQWNGETRDYEGGYFYSPEGKNMISITNEASSNVPINAELKFSPASEYAVVDGYFTNAESEQITSLDIQVGEEASAYLHLVGELDESAIPDNFTVGSCTVVVRGG